MFTVGDIGYLDGRAAKFKLPKTIDYVAELPRDPNGKLYKRPPARPVLERPRPGHLRCLSP